MVHYKTIRFDQKRPVKKVQAQVGAGPYRITFLDQKNQEVGVYNPKNLGIGGAIHEIAENEHLIGVYGLKEKDNDCDGFFRAFGFIVKTNNY